MEDDRWAIGRKMERSEIEALREQVSCAAVLAHGGFAIDPKESTRRAVKFRRGGEIVIVTYEGRGWFDPLSDAKGDVFRLVEHLDRVGFQITEPEWQPAKHGERCDLSLPDCWQSRRRPWPDSASWRYLNGERYLPPNVLRTAIKGDLLREGPQGSMWAAHRDQAGVLTGWEARGPQYRGFASGGTKVLFRLGSDSAMRLAVTEAAIDAISLAAIEGLREGTLYLSTGGGWSPTTEAALRELAARPGVQMVAATDGNPQGDMFADRLRALADDKACDWTRLRPAEEDWNVTLKIREREKRERTEGGGVPHARRRVKGGFARLEPAHDPGGCDAGDSQGVMKD